MKEQGSTLGKIAVYSRKSRFTGIGESIENQIELCRQYIRTHYTNVKEEDVLIYEDEGYSGSNMQRPQFKKMMKDGANKGFSVIVCYRLDRISRNIGDFAKLIEELNDLSIAFVSIKEQFDTASPLGRAMMYIASVFSQLEHETIAERIRDNMQELAKTGRWLGGTTPTGFSSEVVERVSEDGKTRKSFRLKLIPKEAQQVKLIFDEFLAAKSLTKTETFLLQNNYKTKNGKPFSRFTIKSILENPVYMIADADTLDYFTKQKIDLFAAPADFDGIHGMMAYNKTIQRRGKTNQPRHMEEWILAVGTHEGIITGADWIGTQELLAQNRSKSYRRPKSNAALLSGLLFCACCGSYMRPKLSQRKNKEGAAIYSYLCEGKEKSRGYTCQVKNPNGNLLDSAVWEEMKTLLPDTPQWIKCLLEGRKLIAAGRAEYEEEYARLFASYEENAAQISALVAALPAAAGTAAEGYFIQQISLLDERGQMLARRMEEAKSLSETQILSDLQVSSLCSQFLSLADTFDRMDTSQKRNVLHTLVKRVEWDGETAHIYLLDGE